MRDVRSWGPGGQQRAGKRRHKATVRQIIRYQCRWSHCDTNPVESGLEREIKVIEDQHRVRFEVGDASFGEPVVPKSGKAQSVQQRVPS